MCSDNMYKKKLLYTTTFQAVDVYKQLEDECVQGQPSPIKSGECQLLQK